jgi:ABC-type polysaccharide/polyol phosphate transport system ATPase subunit
MAKAARRFKQLIERSGILVLASHSDAAVRQFCTKGVFLENGRLVFFGPVDEALARYQSRAA